MPEATTRQQMLESGDADIVISIAIRHEAFASNPDFTVSTEPALFNYTAFFNTSKAPLDDVKVRQALSYAIPYEDIISIGASGRGTQSHGTAPNGVLAIRN